MVSPLSPERENDLKIASFRLFGAPEAARREAPARVIARRAPVKPRAPAMPLPATPLPSLNPGAAKDYYDKLREFQPAADTGRLEKAVRRTVEPEEAGPPEKAWSMPEGSPYIVKAGVEIWHADKKEPVRWYEELGEFEFKYGRTGLDVEAMAVRRASRMGASGFIVLSAGRMDTGIVSEIEFRRGREQDLTVNDMDVKEYGNIYDSENFSTRSRMKQDAFYLRVKFFKYY